MKVLDFGLAKAWRATRRRSVVPRPGAVADPRGHRHRRGAHPGHRGLHSPEQARGKAVDKRADISSWPWRPPWPGAGSASAKSASSWSGTWRARSTCRRTGSPRSDGWPDPPQHASRSSPQARSHHLSQSPGSRLGPYEIVAPIGAGGMGEVYRASDTKLERDVAIKVLPAESPQDPERLARFEREAQLLAALNHPNIAAIYGLEEADGHALPGAGARRGRGSRRAPEARPDSRRRGDRHRAADRRGARGGAREGHRPPRPQARQRQAHAGRQGEGARLRPRQGAGRGDGDARSARADLSQSPTLAAHRHRSRA